MSKKQISPVLLILVDGFLTRLRSVISMPGMPMAPVAADPFWRICLIPGHIKQCGISFSELDDWKALLSLTLTKLGLIKSVS